ncbi:MAG: hypothetical protein LUE14_04060 [Clostridiales bacterium]|nr:hypothetical protein [Clostridiales bacterium]
MAFTKYVLSYCDGYEIDTRIYDTREQAYAAMFDAYHAACPEDNDMSSEEMSYISEGNAILYRNGEDVLIWDITRVENTRAGALVRNLAELLREIRGDLYNHEFAAWLMAEAGMMPEEISGCGIMDLDTKIGG